MAYAYIDNGVVKECFRVDPFRIVTPGYAALFVEVSDEVEQGWIYDGETFSPPVKVELDLAMAERDARNQKLVATDWTQLPDVPEATRNAYTAYRQALRDVPAQEGFPNDIVWPVAPGA
jgi:hypothetical protein